MQNNVPPLTAATSNNSAKSAIKALTGLVTATPYYNPLIHPVKQHNFTKSSYYLLKTAANTYPVVMGGLTSGAVGAMSGFGIVAGKEMLELGLNKSQRQWLGDYLIKKSEVPIKQPWFTVPSPRWWQSATGWVQRKVHPVTQFLPRGQTHLLESCSPVVKGGYLASKGLVNLSIPVGAGMIGGPFWVLAGLGATGLKEFLAIATSRSQQRVIGQWLKKIS